jgi:hypothetical protein
LEIFKYSNSKITSTSVGFSLKDCGRTQTGGPSGFKVRYRTKDVTIQRLEDQQGQIGQKLSELQAGGQAVITVR